MSTRAPAGLTTAPTPRGADDGVSVAERERPRGCHGTSAANGVSRETRDGDGDGNDDGDGDGDGNGDAATAETVVI